MKLKKKNTKKLKDSKFEESNFMKIPTYGDEEPIQKTQSFIVRSKSI